MLRGSAWALLMRWGIRGIGIVSTIILARLLTPADFGIVAMASLVLGLLATFSGLGAGALLIRLPDVTRAHCDTAWSVRLLQGAFVVLALSLTAPLAARYFGEPRLVPVIYVLSVSAILNGAQNIGMVLVRKELDFAKDFRFNIYARLLAFAITVPLALAFRTYWALVLGQVCAAALELLLSYRMHPYRPRFSLEKAREFLVFAAAIVPINIASFLNSRVDIFVVGRIAGTSMIGAYNVAAELSSMVSDQITRQIGRALAPSYAKLTHDEDKLVEAFLYVLAAVAALALPLGFGLSAVANDFVQLVLGSQWGAAVPLVQWLAIYGSLRCLAQVMSGAILVISGHERLSASLAWLRLAVLTPSVILGAHYMGVIGVAVAATGTAVILLPVNGYFLTRALSVRFGQITAVLWRPIAAAVVMLALVSWLHTEEIRYAILRLGLEVGIGVITYATVLIVLWSLSGRPRGLESTILTSVNSRFQGASTG